MSTESVQPRMARAELDRNAVLRTDPETIERLRNDPATRVIVIRDDQTLVSSAGEITYLPPSGIDGDATWGYLGTNGSEHFLVCSAGASAHVDDNGGEWMNMRSTGGEMSAFDAGVFVEALSLARWYDAAPFCPRCGTSTTLTQAGWARVCDGCNREHFPRTDPAVIVAVVDGDRILLGSNAMWESRRFSCFAGFVEAGESLESAVHREVEEEAGVALSGVRYFGSQAWPYPRSLMLGFFADVTTAAVARPDGDEILEVRWFTRAEIHAAYAGDSEILLPGSSSIAYALLSSWAQL